MPRLYWIINKGIDTCQSPMKRDVIIVLGAAVWPDGQPSPSLARRVGKSVDLYKSERAENIIMSGGIGKYPPAEAIVMKRIALEGGVPEERIFMDEKSTNTYQSAINCLAIMNNHDWGDAIVVSDSYHLTRSVFLFKALGKPAEGIPSAQGRGKTKRWKWLFYHFREVLALFWYTFRIAIYILQGQLPEKSKRMR
ncbi:MAG: YdcF family protein [Candidatus Thiosymbion ectosymbiont of Robbea hypermnestra]|nr:YdcF family protein [Candidatus Thiosymbion ectosymbiont of Robbea hypermnestra]